MNDNQDRVDRIRRLLEEALAPEYLEVLDESALHAGHPGARSGAGHFRVRIRAASLTGLSRLAAHRRIHAALSPMMAADIHALSIEIEQEK